MNKSHLSPNQVTLDIVLPYATDGYGIGVRMINKEPLRLLIVGTNHRGQVFQQIIEPHLDGGPDDGPPVRFVLFQLGPTVWKITPSLQVPGLVHGYLTFFNVPEPAPWIDAK